MARIVPEEGFHPAEVGIWYGSDSPMLFVRVLKADGTTAEIQTSVDPSFACAFIATYYQEKVKALTEASS